MKEYMDGLVSVVTPMYNSEKYIRQTIESVQKQTYDNWEMIIVDDCSSDRSVQIAQEFAAHDRRIHVILNKENQGVAVSRNISIANASGRYIAFLDSDDLWRPKKLEMQLKLMKKKGSAFCYGACGVIDAAGRDIKKNRMVPEQLTYKQLLRGNQIPCLTVIIDRQVVCDVQMPPIPHEDYATWLTILKEQQIRAFGVQELIADYRERRESLSGGKLKAMSWAWNVYYNYLHLSFAKSLYYLGWHGFRSLKKRI